MAVDAERFRALFGAFPTTVTVVTTLDEGGAPQGFTCSAVTAVSIEPPLLLVCVGRRARTLPGLLASGVFVVNVLADGGQETARVFASRSDRKFSRVRWLPSTAAGGAPLLLEGVLARAECAVVRTVEAGDHRIVMGRVDAVEVLPGRPVLYQQGNFGVWDGPERAVLGRAP
jgi:flavin reductase (DIM6/NTAB) family NADH-FMN oxidoreductase RutF